MSSTARKKTSSRPRNAAQSATNPDRKRKAKKKKWSKDKAQKEVDKDVDMLYSVHALGHPQEHVPPPKNQDDKTAESVHALEQTLQAL